MKNIRVGFDISQTAHIGGVATYTDYLSRGLHQRKDVEMVYFYSSFRKPYRGKLKPVKCFRLPPSLFEVLFNKIRNVPIEQFIGPIDVFHKSDWVQPPTKAKKVTTFHDVVAFKYPQWSVPKIVAVHKRRLAIVEREVDKVIAVSESTKQDLIECTQIPANKIVVVYEGVDEQFHVSEEREVADFKEKHKLPKKFVLAIGGIGERRNLKRVKEAVGDYDLVISGETLPWLKWEELPLLYSSAEVLLYPSLYEGFGLPILEAMACGIPVITSNVSSMPEVGGKAAVYVDPYNIDDISKRVDEVMNDNQLRKGMIKKGLSRIKQFTWARSVEDTVSIYKKLCDV